ncbi:uncharacterized protein TNCV_3123951 [Trichonephila clavipes]|nr:uncharacterized protein TNCV_3123951 [Trichonephila clavipes]
MFSMLIGCVDFRFYNFRCHPFGIVVSDANCCAVGPGVEYQRRDGCLQMYSAFVAWGILNSRRATSPLVWLVEGEERGSPLTTSRCPPSNWGEIELNNSVTCVVLKATENDRLHLALCHDEFRGP